MTERIKFKSSFIGHFKLGDNIQYDLKILNFLNSINEEPLLLCKPKILLLTSIIESIIADLFEKIELNIREGVNNIKNSDITKIRKTLNSKKNTPSFCFYIEQAKNYKLLGNSSDLYNNLHNIRKIRNRIHNYNLYNHTKKERDQKNIFTIENQTLTEQTFIKVITEMTNKYDRGLNYVGEFQYYLNKK